MSVTGSAAAGELALEVYEALDAIARRPVVEGQLVPRMALPLQLLASAGPMTTSELAQLRRIRHQSMAATVDDLDGRGYVDRSPHPTDVRKVLIEINDDGRERLQADLELRAAWLSEALAAELDDDERARLSDGIALLLRALSAGSQP